MSKPKRPDKWDKKAEQMWTIIKANFNGEHPWGVRPNSLTLIASALRRTDAAAYRRGVCKGHDDLLPRPRKNPEDS